MRGAASIAIFWVLVGCTKPPEIPRLHRPSFEDPYRVILDDHLSPNDIRQIFRAVNRNGRLDSLKPYLETPTDEELRGIADLISKYVFEETERREGLLALLESRIDRRSFSSSWESARRWAGRADYRDGVELLAAVSSSPLLVDLVELDVGFLHPRFAPLLQATWIDARDRYQERLSWGPSPEIRADSVQATLRKILGNALIRAKLPRLLGQLDAKDFGANVLLALNQIRARPEGIATFEGLGRGIARLLPGVALSENRLEKLLGFLHFIDTPSAGLFTAIGDKIRREPVTLDVLAALFQPISSRGAAGYAREILSARREDNGFYGRAFWESVALRNNEQPSAGFQDLFRVLRDAGERITNNPSVLLANSYALARWFEEVIKRTQQGEAWRAADLTTFHERFWGLRAETAELTIDLRSPTTLRDLAALQLPDLGDAVYNFRLQRGVSFRDALDAAMSSVDEIRPYADISGFIRAYAFPFTRPSERPLFSLADFETDGMLDGLNRFLLSLEPETCRRIDQTFFEDLRVGALPQNLRNYVLDLYDRSPELRDRVVTILDNVQALHEFMVPVEGLPSPFDTYHALLHNTRKTDIDTISKLFSFMGEVRLVSLSGEPATADYPAIFQWLQRGDSLARTLSGLSSIPRDQHGVFLAPFEKAVGGREGVGITKHLAFFDVIDHRTPAGMRSLLDQFSMANLIDGLNAISPAEKNWITRFIDEKDFRTFWNYLSLHSDRSRLRGLVRDMRTLATAGLLRDAFQLLGQLQNERLRRIGAVLEKWETTGELVKFLDTMDIALGRPG